jgi:hypothetical protein
VPAVKPDNSKYLTSVGARNTPLYNVWCSMKQRCYNPKSTRWQWYGARGIKVCKRWLTSFRTFVDDMGPRPPGTWLERKNHNRGYKPSNCTWATPKQQMNNTTANHFLTFQGERLTVMQWSERTGISWTAISQRINYLKWSVRKTLTTPYRYSPHNHRLRYRGKWYRPKDLAKMAGLKPVTFVGRINQLKWSVAKAVETPLNPKGNAVRCLRGHRFDKANTYITPSGNRQCRACNRINHHRRYHGKERS